MNRLYTSFPMVMCPHCEKEFQVDDYYCLEAGDSFDCGHCKKEIHIHFVDTIIECQLGTEPAT